MLSLIVNLIGNVYIGYYTFEITISPRIQWLILCNKCIAAMNVNASTVYGHSDAMNHHAGNQASRTSSDHIVYAPSQWETTLHCNVVSDWLVAYTKRSLEYPINVHVVLCFSFFCEYSSSLWIHVVNLPISPMVLSQALGQSYVPVN